MSGRMQGSAEALGPGVPLPEMGLTVAAVARRLGVAPATLRTWDRRYGLGPSQHSAGAHRRYSSADVERLERMRRYVLSGVAPAEAARAALTEGEVEPDAGARHGGGQVVAIPDGTPQARGLARAALALDADACRVILAETLDRRGVVWTWDHLIAPVLVGVGQRWEQSGRGIDVEHVLSEAIQSELSSRVVNDNVRSVAAVVLASAPGENHVLPLWALAAALSERGVEVRMLGARTPWDALGQAIRRIGPGGVLVWSQTAGSGDMTDMAVLPDVRPEPLILLGGPGWHPGAPPRGEHVDDLSEAVARLARAAGAS
ncbi:MAG: MerR family transcriptional regulator [Actinomycetales bacterium]|nr:MerR family transcriptional regulator [Actinomycetales bacterium]